MAFRARFRHDVVVDLVGYRRFGHNEQRRARLHTTADGERGSSATRPVRQLYAQALASQGLVPEGHDEELLREVQASLKEAHEQLKEELAAPA